MFFDNHKLTSYTATLRFMRTFGDAPDPVILAFLRGRAETAWGILDSHLAGRRFVVGEHLTIADLSLCGYLFWPDEIGVDWNSYPHIRDWLARIAALPRYKPPYELMPGHRGRLRIDGNERCPRSKPGSTRATPHLRSIATRWRRSSPTCARNWLSSSRVAVPRPAPSTRRAANCCRASACVRCSTREARFSNSRNSRRTACTRTTSPRRESSRESDA
jgi:hypothetical protein